VACPFVQHWRASNIVPVLSDASELIPAVAIAPILPDRQRHVKRARDLIGVFEPFAMLGAELVVAHRDTLAHHGQLRAIGPIKSIRPELAREAIK
jgi:hypothetical protein